MKMCLSDLTELGSRCGDIAKGQMGFWKEVLAPLKLWEISILRAEWWCKIIVPKAPSASLMPCTSEFFFSSSSTTVVSIDGFLVPVMLKS